MPEIKDKQATTEEIQAWVESEAKELAVRHNFPQVFRDPDTGRFVDFAKITDHDELMRTSEEVEKHYLQHIQQERRKFVTSHGSGQQQEALRQFEREMAKGDLYYLTKFVLQGYPDLVFHFHYFMAIDVQGKYEGGRSLAEYPRDAFKSTVRIIGKNVQLIINNPNIRILIKSNAEANASSKLTETKNAFIMDRNDPLHGSEDWQKLHPYEAGCLSLQSLFPEHVPKTNSQRGSGTRWDSPAKTSVQSEGTLTAAGVGTSKTSQHYDLVQGDDFWDEKSVTSAEVMTKARGEMNRLEYLLASPAKGQIEFTGTRFAHDDPTVDLQEDPSYTVTICSGVTPEGRALFPENLPLHHIYSKWITQRYDCSCQIMLNPSDDSQGFSRSWFRYKRWEDIQKERDNGECNVAVRILTDAATDDKDSSDEVSIIALAVDSKERKTVIEAIEEKMQPSDFISEIYRLAEKYSAEFVVRQKTAIETTIMSFVKQEQRRRRENGEMTVRFYDYSLRKRKKKSRITSALQPPVQSGYLYFDPDMSNLNDIERELLEHPNSQRDHTIDALSEIDDPVVSRTPTHVAPSEPEPEYHPSEADFAPDKLMKRNSARRIFEQARGGSKQKLKAGARIA